VPARWSTGGTWRAFYYRSYSVSPTFYRVAPAIRLAVRVRPRYDRICSSLDRVTKDLAACRARRAVYAGGQWFASTDPAAPEGVVAAHAGLDRYCRAPFEPIDGRVNVQVFKRTSSRQWPDLALSLAIGVPACLFSPADPELGAVLQWIQTSVAGADDPASPWPGRLFRLSIAFGVDIFNGDRNGLFGPMPTKTARTQSAVLLLRPPPVATTEPFACRSRRTRRQPAALGHSAGIPRAPFRGCPIFEVKSATRIRSSTKAHQPRQHCSGPTTRKQNAAPIERYVRGSPREHCGPAVGLHDAVRGIEERRKHAP